MSNPRTVTITTTTTKTIGQIAYEASDPTEHRAHWHDLTDERRAKWERIAEAVAKALERPVHVPTPVSVGNPSHPFNIPGQLVPAPRPADPLNPETWPLAPRVTYGGPPWPHSTWHGPAVTKFQPTPGDDKNP